MRDGTYTLEERTTSTVIVSTFSITVKDSKITEEATTTTSTKMASPRRLIRSYEANMKKVNKVGPKGHIPELNKSLVAKQSPAKVDVVSGATHSSDTFILYADQLVNAAQNGNTNKIEVDNIVYNN